MKTYGIKDLCERFAVGEHTVLAWVRSGELRAIDVSRKQGGRPKWRITQEALEAFALARTSTPPPPRGRRRNKPADVIEFYK
jgi:excisionase family DNA binding protein